METYVEMTIRSLRNHDSEGEEKEFYYEDMQFQRFARAFLLIFCLFHRRSLPISCHLK